MRRLIFSEIDRLLDASKTFPAEHVPTTLVGIPVVNYIYLGLAQLKKVEKTIVIFGFRNIFALSLDQMIKCTGLVANTCIASAVNSFWSPF